MVTQRKAHPSVTNATDGVYGREGKFTCSFDFNVDFEDVRRMSLVFSSNKDGGMAASS